MRTLIDYEPFGQPEGNIWGQGNWTADWIAHPDTDRTIPAVFAYRNRFTLDTARTIRVHVTADERYELYLDGERVGRGPERGDPANWFFETYDFELSAGEHLFVARTWTMGTASPAAQMSTRPGFLLLAEGEPEALLNTGQPAWTVKVLPGYSTIPAPATGLAGDKWALDGSAIAWGFERGEGDGWTEPAVLCKGRTASIATDDPAWWLLRPSTLPPMIAEQIVAGTVRHVEAIASFDTGIVPVRSANHMESEAASWRDLWSGRGAVTLPPHTRRRVLIDLENYYCAFPALSTSAGAGSTVRLNWAESLYLKAGEPDKGNRNEIEGKAFDGVGDIFAIGGGSRTYEPLWWESGRYLEIAVETAVEPLTIDALTLTETRYPHSFTGQFEASDSRLADVIPIAIRTLEMCSHETYFDCPYYEQLMYVGDTRLEVLTTYALSGDDRLPRKAIKTFDRSRLNSGMTQSRYPSRLMQIIPPFSLWWIGMVHDYAHWRDDPEFVTGCMPGVRAVLEAWREYITVDGLVRGPVGWNFTDWVPSWEFGVPPDAAGGISGVLNWHLAVILKLAADLEEIAGEPLLASRNRATAESITKAAGEAFWCGERGLYADDLARTKFSEHSQCLALLAGNVTESKRAHVAERLFTDPDIERATIYFAHYLFETHGQFARPDLLLDRLSLWFDLRKHGFVTTFESPEPSRSDCHAWGAHPVFHYFATLIGIRPSAPGFAKVRITPQPGPLTWLRGTMPHPKGEIAADLQFENGEITGSIGLPWGVSGELVYGGNTQVLHGGTQAVGF